jgi:hypothetical protein
MKRLTATITTTIKTILLSELAHLASAVITLLLSRWMLELSSIEKDIAWLRDRLARCGYYLRWYSGVEAWHQWRGRKILASI